MNELKQMASGKASGKGFKPFVKKAMAAAPAKAKKAGRMAELAKMGKRAGK